MKTVVKTDNLTALNIAANIDDILFQRKVNEDFSFVYICPSITKLTGFDAESYTNCSQSWLNLIFPKDEKVIKKALKNLIQHKKSISLEYRLLTKNSDYVDVLEKAYPLTDEFGNITEICGIISDNTEFKRAQEELARTQMLQSLGKLAAGVAHEINTPIQFIGDNIRFVSDSFEEIRLILNLYQSLVEKYKSNLDSEVVNKIESTCKEYDIDFLKGEIPLAIEQTLEGIERVSAMVSVMKDFSHLDERRKTAADINKIIQSAIIISKNEIKYIADIEKQLDKNIPKLICCIDEIYQVILNMLINAAHSIQEKNEKYQSNIKGKITVSTQFIDGSIIITIADTGLGIPEEIKEKIFESFFTTKTKGKGTGQGLAIAHSIICQKHNGSITFDSKTGEGTCFKISLPINLQDNQRDEIENASR